MKQLKLSTTTGHRISGVSIMFLLVAAIPGAMSLAGYGGSSGGGGSGGSLINMFPSSFGSGAASGGQQAYGGGGGDGGGPRGPVTTAIESTRTVEVKPIQMMNEPHEPQVVEVPSEDMPVTVHFKSQSSRVLVQQTHTPAQIAEPEHTSSEDEPQRVIHEVVKPVIQEIREIIQPYRRLIQQVQPVIEQTHTVIAKGEPRPPVQPIPVAGASQGAMSGPGYGGGSAAGGSKFGGGGGAGGGFKAFGNGGSGGGYAAAASSVSMKSSPPEINQRPGEKRPSVHHQQQHQSFNGNNGNGSNNNNNKATATAAAQASADQKYAQAIKMAFVPANANNQNNNGYASRRGDFQESYKPQQQQQYHQQSSGTRISVRPAPEMMNHSHNGRQQPSAMVAPTRMTLKPISDAYPNVPVAASSETAAAASIIEPRYDEPIMPMSSYPQHSFTMPYHHEEDLTPLITFIAQPVRFRARA